MVTVPAKTNQQASAFKSRPNSKHKIVGGMNDPRKNVSNKSIGTKHLKFVSKTCATGTMAGAVFNKLDPFIPEQKRRLEQRRKMVSYGKNTTGYEEYLKQVPKEKRMPHSMETPTTPDYTLDIPNKRWQGQIRAWRRALHNYDPPDFQASLASVANPMDSESTKGPDCQMPNLSLQDQELADAKKNGLLVDIGGKISTELSPTSVLSGDQEVQQTAMKELDQWDNARNDDGADFGLDDDDDSDDELL